MGVPTVEDGASQGVQVYCVSLNGCTLCVYMVSQDFPTSVGMILHLWTGSYTCGQDIELDNPTCHQHICKSLIPIHQLLVCCSQLRNSMLVLCSYDEVCKCETQGVLPDH